MKLNIHIISHPIIQNLSHVASDSIATSKTNQVSKHLGLLIIYETIRNLLKVYKLTIKKITCKKEIVIIDPKESYTLIFNSLHLLTLFQDIQSLLPKVDLQLIKNRELEELNRDEEILKNIHIKTKIIIINNEINLKYLKKLMNSLVNSRKVQLHQIFLTCIRCEATQLIQISKDQFYKDLNIYTTQIIKN